MKRIRRGWLLFRFILATMPWQTSLDAAERAHARYWEARREH